MFSHTATNQKFEDDAVISERDIPVIYDLGNLTCTDYNVVHPVKFRNNKERYIQEISKSTVQELINTVWRLPRHGVEDVIVVKLPKTSLKLPREKPVPKQKSLTRWEKFAREKGISKRKKNKSVWDESLKKWVPRWGYKKTKSEKMKNWVIEIPDHADPYVDAFSKETAVKKERIAKNELRRLQNIARQTNIKTPKLGIIPTSTPSTSQLMLSASKAKISTASMGKFTKEPLHMKSKSKRKPPVKRKKRMESKRRKLRAHGS